MNRNVLANSDRRIDLFEQFFAGKLLGGHNVDANILLGIHLRSRRFINGIPDSGSFEGWFADSRPKIPVEPRSP
jgi:hypothetical protein